MQTIVKTIATFFYIGYLPGPKGTFSALAALLVYCLIKGSILSYILITLILCLLGFLVSGRAEEIFGRKDAPQIVIDDACGMLVALFLVPQRLVYIISAVVLYRVLDIIKAPPIRRLEGLKGAPGVMLDDIVAGIYTNILLQIWGRFTLL